MNDTTFIELLLILIHFSFLAIIMDVETAFLNEELEEEIYIEHPLIIIDAGKDDCTILEKCSYGMVQVERQK